MISVITSGKGGTGKSTVSVGLGAALAQRGQTVLLLDCDAGLRSLDLLLGIAADAVHDLSDVFSGNCEPVRAIYPSAHYPGLSVIPSPADLSRMCSPDDMRRLSAGLARFFDQVIIDCPAGIGRGFECAVAGADRAIVVTTGDAVSARDACTVGGLLESKGISARLVVNRLRPDLVQDGEMPDIDEIMDMAGLPLLGVVPDDDDLFTTLHAGLPLPRGSNAAVCFANIAARFLGERVLLAALEKM